MLTRELLRREWTAFRRPGRLIALAAAALAVIASGLLHAFGSQVSCDGPCPAAPVAADGSAVGDHFWFLHRGLGPDGVITVRMTSMSGTITYPPPHHDRIVPGLVPWAKAGIIVKDGVRPGSSYAALMMTGEHGVRMQHDYRHDIAGSPGGLSPRSPRWLRLARSGDTVTGSESADGRTWRTVGTVRLAGLPETVRVGLFAASPGDLTLREVGLGGTVEQVRFTQATGVFDHVTVEGSPGGSWRSEAVGGGMNHTDWEKHHNASGAVEKDGVITVSGTGDIGPGGGEGAFSAERTLSGLLIALIIVLVLAARFGARPDGPETRGVLAARAAALGAATFATVLAAACVALPAGLAILSGKGVPVQQVSPPTGARVVIGVAAVLALCALLAYGLGLLTRRGPVAALLALALVAVPYAVTAVPLLPDAVSQWLLRLTPAAGFAVQQTAVEYPQVIAHYAPSAGYFPLPGWAGFAVLCAYTLAVLWPAVTRTPADRPADRR
ncbi:hypothetical protein [Planomonospora venezuelensis]|uniref:DUF1349 domain-containing protein n=1 Tax=Planomonospora venezuelensis TaxID=1999 RepID=A0A841DGE4_PLAVE|nr:hypothetical protein [Planomonospora venezuelensis]MBB5967793.1 hypothetical protein [Planomonospora venezuelensis]GIN03214.1 hypothetical protein Pve01_48720 [Planomonospora venezuelensis]